MIGQTVLITGGSGTFGTAMTRYALAHGAARVIAIARNEHRLSALRSAIPDPRLEIRVRDVRDREGLWWAFGAQPDVVIHAAAMKRVEICEDEPDEAYKTNVAGTRHVVQVAMERQIPQVLVISSDKATSPETTYGKTKAMAEEIAIGQNALRGSGPTRISVVRYGNVLGSAGSFLDRIYQSRQTGEPLPITDPACTRYWWSIEDAVAFVASVLEQMQGADIWIPKLASSRVVDLAKAIAPDAAIEIVGTRGPEKSHEAMVNSTEASYCWELSDRFVLLPKHGQWWSPEPPRGAVKVRHGFSYTSADHPATTVTFEECA